MVGFCLGTLYEANCLTKSFIDVDNEDGIHNVCRIILTSYGGRVVFNNCSSIEIFAASNLYSSVWHGRRLHDVFWNERVNDFWGEGKAFEKFTRLLTSYNGQPIPQFKSSEWTDNVESEALDEFFNSLTIV
jgi:hypothetical protein